MSSIACNVVLLPNSALADRAIQTSNQLADRGVVFTLAEGTFYPHVSVYMLQLRTADLAEAGKRLREIAKATTSLSLEAKKYWQARQFLDAEYEKSKALSELQAQVVGALNPIRDGMITEEVARMQEASGLRLENYKRYGWNAVGELYRPHLTLTCFKQDEDISALGLPDISKFSDTFSKIGLYEMGSNGTCIRQVAEYKLGES
jgi:hypothetical protein